MPKIPFNNSFAQDMEGFYVPYQPDSSPNPALLFFNDDLAKSLCISVESNDTDLAQVFSGTQLPDNASPLAQVYAGHQFGYFNPQLGDGRALLLGEVINGDKQRMDIVLKGSGRTPFSRGGDGKAAVSHVLREVLISEAMHNLGVPTTRALAAIATGEIIYREQPLPGAVLTRVASSHLRVGTFQFFASREENEKVKQLADYAIKRHDPELLNNENPYRAFLDKVIERQAKLVAQWVSLGFIHGVMNTDNMSIAGETIDYGPCAFMENYKPDTFFSSVDEYGRYAYKNQAPIAQWNLARFAESLLALLADDIEEAKTVATERLEQFRCRYEQHRLSLFSAKLGLKLIDQERNQQLIDSWLLLLEKQSIDFTLAWRYLSDMDSARLLDLFADKAGIQQWINQWQSACEQQNTHKESHRERLSTMQTLNPWLIPRNYRVEEALEAATAGDLTRFNTLHQALAQPYSERTQYAQLAEPATAVFNKNYRTFCGT
ncbi:MAG: YdiU family protein [Pseudomonadota bacterium]